MNREATEKLRLDRRLIQRRGWISRDEREKLLEELPDVSHKIAPPEDEQPAEAAPAGESVSEAAGEAGVDPAPPRVE
jgi:hypothetical protein